ncbi:hypothetical protein M8818_007921 [Zalaria obscura]|uniref:Uncharacterized protein n=1 Tax=Zalaria obscura TaxID=2024903 RepID=A0ACC3S2W7_9PEZI
MRRGQGSTRDQALQRYKETQSQRQKVEEPHIHNPATLSPVRQRGASGRTLLEELFPEEARRTSGEERKREREIPRLPLAQPDPSTVAPPPPRKEQGPPKSQRARELEEQLAAQNEQISVLVLRNASKSLTEEDFKRVIPKGKHIEGWNLEQGDIIQVIPGRNTTTLERENHYFLLFKSAISAFTYQGHVSRLHNLARAHAPSSLLSAIPPPPGLEIDGEDVHAAMESYALLPPSQNISIRQLRPPLSPLVQQLIRHRGYPHVVNRPDRSPAEVLLRLEGPSLTLSELQDAFRKSEEDRMLPWTRQTMGGLQIAKWEVKSKPVSPLSDEALDEGPSSEEPQLNEESKEPETVTYTAFQSDAEQKARLEEAENARKRSPAFILGFQDLAEAESFARYWHRRPVELEDFSFDMGDSAPIANAEVLW